MPFFSIGGSNVGQHAFGNAADVENFYNKKVLPFPLKKQS